MSQYELSPLSWYPAIEEHMQVSHLQLVPAMERLKELLIYRETVQYVAFWCDAYVMYQTHRWESKPTEARYLGFPSCTSSSGRSDFEELFGSVWDTNSTIAKCRSSEPWSSGCSLSWNPVKCLANHIAISEGLCELARIVQNIHSDDIIVAYMVEIHGEDVVEQMLQIPELREMEIKPEELSNCISHIMASTEYQTCAIELRGEEALVLINMINFFLGSCSPDKQNFLWCICTLKRMCTLNNILPTALVLTDDLLTNKSVPDNCGGLANIYQGLYQGRLVALKSLCIYGHSDLQSLREALLKAVITWSHLRHPNVVPFVGVMVVDEEKFEQFPLCMVSHWMEHGTLLEYIRNFPSANRLDLLVDIASGLEYLHKYTIHGDLKGSNILIDGQKRASISDCGLAIVANGTLEINTIAGSTRWMAPELANPATSSVLKPTRETDVYSFSMVIVEVFTGAVPFHEQSDTQVIIEILRGIRPNRPSNARMIGLSDSVWSLMEYCWHHSPDQRPSMSHVLPKLVKSRDEFALHNASVANTNSEAQPNANDKTQIESQGPVVVVENNSDMETDDLPEGTTVHGKAVLPVETPEPVERGLYQAEIQEYTLQAIDLGRKVQSHKVTTGRLISLCEAYVHQDKKSRDREAESELLEWVKILCKVLLKRTRWDTFNTLINHEVIWEDLNLLFSSTPSLLRDMVTHWQVFIAVDQTDMDDIYAKTKELLDSNESLHQIFRLRGATAKSILELLDTLRHSTHVNSNDRKFRRHIDRISIKLCGLAGQVPSSCVLSTGLSKVDDNPCAAGGFADVYRGSHNGVMVALKVVRVVGQKNIKKAHKTFYKEALMWKWLVHRNIVPFLGIASPEMFPLCLVSMWMKNGNLLEYIGRYQANPFKLASDVANGLTYIHTLGLVHGDLKSPNILVDKWHKACLSDFGLSRVAQETQANGVTTTATNSQHGSTRWMAPELIQADPSESGFKLSSQSDVYAFGMVLLEIFTGKVPFYECKHEVPIMFEVISGRRPNRPKQTKLPGLEDEVWNLIEDCWKADPAQRPKMLTALHIVERFLGKAPQLADYLDPMATGYLGNEESDEDGSESD